MIFSSTVLNANDDAYTGISSITNGQVVYSDFTVHDSSFTNKYGTPATKCNHAGCNNYIASSGDTNCCTLHSSKCLECGKYIDEDAIYCMDCITRSIGSNSSKNPSGSSTFTNKYGTPTTKCNHSGCTNYIATSGDTNCCTTHSSKCLECGKYIDEDAIYCMDCMSKASSSFEKDEDITGIWAHNMLLMGGGTLSEVVELHGDASFDFYFLNNHEEIGDRISATYTRINDIVVLNTDQLALEYFLIGEENYETVLYENGINRYRRFGTMDDIPFIEDTTASLTDLTGLWEHDDSTTNMIDQFVLGADGSCVYNTLLTTNDLGSKIEGTADVINNGSTLSLNFESQEEDMLFTIRRNGIDYLLYNEDGVEFHHVYPHK